MPVNTTVQSAGRTFQEQASMKVVPAAWQHYVPHAFEKPFSENYHSLQPVDERQQQDGNFLVHAPTHVAPSPPAGSQHPATAVPKMTDSHVLSAG